MAFAPGWALADPATKLGHAARATLRTATSGRTDLLDSRPTTEHHLVKGSVQLAPARDKMTGTFFEELFLRHNAIMLLIDASSGRIVRANEAAERFYGWPSATLCSMTIQQINQLSEDEVAAECQRALAEERNHFVFKHVLRGGDVRTVEVHSSPAQVDGATLLLSIIHDITEKARAEQALQESEQRFRQFFDAAPDAMIVADAETGDILAANAAASQLTGRAIAELVGRHFSELHPSGTSDFASKMFIAHAGGLASPVEHEVVRADGACVPVEVTARPIKVQGRTQLLGIFRDISTRRRAEAALHESEIRWQFAIESSGDGLWDWNPETNEVFYSHRWKAMLGFDDGEIGSSLDEWERRVHPDDRQHVTAALQAHLRGDTPVYVSEYRFLHKDQSWRWILDRGKVLSRTPDGRPLRVVGVHTDITERKRADMELLQANERLAQALATVKQLEGVLPMCSFCKRIRTDDGQWLDVAVYVRTHSEAEVSHGLCPTCAVEHYGMLMDE